MKSQTTDNTLLEAVERVFSRLAAAAHASNQGEMDLVAGFWSEIDELGISLLLVPEDRGGFGGTWCDFQRVVSRLGFYALPLPVGETLLVRGLLEFAGVDSPNGPLSFTVCHEARIDDTRVPRMSAELVRVPWGRAANLVLIELEAAGEPRRYFLVRAQDVNSIENGVNLAGEPCDKLILRDTPVTPVELSTPSLVHLGALLRAAQISGALECALELSVAHVRERSQFGRPLAQFQAIQQQLAVLAEEAAACQCAALAAAAAVGNGLYEIEVAAAKIRANMAVSRAAFIAHQCHGAVGMTAEHPLQRTTRRLWAWRSESGNDRYWEVRLGQQVLDQAGQGLWSMLTDRSDCSADLAP